MKKQFKNWEIERCKAIMNMESLDKEVIDEDGEPSTLGNVIGNDDQASYTRLKVILLSFVKKIKSRTQQKIMTLIIEGYAPEDITEKLGISKQLVSLTVTTFKKKLKPEMLEFLIKRRYQH